MSFFLSPYIVSQSIEIDAPQEKVFELVQDFKNWNTWSPWYKYQKDAENNLQGLGTKVGDIISWAGDLIGDGELEHQEINSPNSILQHVRFTKPFKSTASVKFFFTQSKGKTTVTWEMHGGFPRLLFFMKKQIVAMISQDYKRGLIMLKSLVETGKVKTDTLIKEVITTPKIFYVGITKTQSIEEMQNSMGVLFEKIWNTLAEKKIECVGNPFSSYHTMDFVNQRVHYTVCFPVEEKDMFSEGQIISGVQESTKVFEVEHFGSFKYLGNSWSAGMNYVIKKLKWNKKISPWEEYISDPAKIPEDELQTRILIPVK